MSLRNIIIIITNIIGSLLTHRNYQTYAFPHLRPLSQTPYIKLSSQIHVCDAENVCELLKPDQISHSVMLLNFGSKAPSKNLKNLSLSLSRGS